MGCESSPAELGVAAPVIVMSLSYTCTYTTYTPILFIHLYTSTTYTLVHLYSYTTYALILPKNCPETCPGIPEQGMFRA